MVGLELQQRELLYRSHNSTPSPECAAEPLPSRDDRVDPPGRGAMGAHSLAVLGLMERSCRSLGYHVLASRNVVCGKIVGDKPSPAESAGETNE
jgi:hypothetical protein